MINLPEAEIYEKELLYMPYKKSLDKVLDIIIAQAPQNATLLDMMCGPGYLLGKINEQRKDIKLLGVDIDKRYIDYSKEKYPNIDFVVGDVLTWKPEKPFDVVICTGSVHHIVYEKQDPTVKNLASMVKPGGLCIISDCHIDDYNNEQERKIAATKLGYEYLKVTIENGAPDEIVKPTINIMYNDVMMIEYKTSVKKRMPIYEKYFKNIEIIKTWPDTDTEYGDYIMICKDSK